VVNRDLLAAKLVEIATRIARVKSHLPRDVEELRRLKQAVGLRNVVAHGNARLGAERCFEAATVGLGDLEDFARQVSAWANRSG